MAQDRETIAVYDAKADDYTKAFSHKGIGSAMQSFMDAMPAEGKVLDLGCGPGRHAKILSEHGFNVCATDASAAMVENARSLGGFKVEQSTFNDLSADNVYDGIWANFSLLHAPREDFPTYVASIAKALKPTGVFHLGMKLGSGEERDGLGRRYSYFTAEEFRAFLTAEGFTILNETLGEGKGLAGTVDPWIEILSRRT